MLCALLQTELEPPSSDALRRAFEQVEGLTVHDSHTMVRGAHGILIHRMPEKLARQIHQVLADEDIETDLVDQQKLFNVLPNARTIRRLTIGADGLVTYDMMDRPHTTPWEHVTLVAGGMVGRIQEDRPGDFLRLGAMVGHHELTRFSPTLEIFLDIKPFRLRIDAQRCNYSYLGERMHTTCQKNFVLLVHDLLDYCQHALMNRGIQSIKPGSSTFYAYPTQHAFDDEVLWWFYRKLQHGKIAV